jgi:hypothetical protein
VCPKIPGAISQGETKEEALINIKEVIELVWEVKYEELHKPTGSSQRSPKSKSPMLHKLSVIADEKMVKILAQQGFEIRRQT